jgi:uncharacterized delta-60 repeat protein
MKTIRKIIFFVKAILAGTDGETFYDPELDTQLDATELLLLRYNTDWSLDTTFGASGQVRLTFGPAQPNGDRNDFGSDVIVQPDGKLVAGGESDGRITLARLLPNGALDPTFGDGGKVLTPIVSGPFNVASAYRLAPAPGDRLMVAGVVAGWTQVDGSRTFRSMPLLARYILQPGSDPNPDPSAPFSLWLPVVIR